MIIDPFDDFGAIPSCNRVAYVNHQHFLRKCVAIVPSDLFHRRIRNDHQHDVAKFDGLRNPSDAGQRTDLIYEPLQCIGMAGRKHHAVPGLGKERAECAALSPGAMVLMLRGGPPAGCTRTRAGEDPAASPAMPPATVWRNLRRPFSIL